MSLDDLTNLSAGDGPLDLDIEQGSKKKRKKSSSQEMEMQQFNPFVSRPNMTCDDRTMDRMITIKRPDVEDGVFWLTDSDFAETLSLLQLNKSEQRAFWKKFRRIQMIGSPRTLNRKIVASRQDRLMMELISQKSRLDVVEGGNINERGMWITQRQQVEQTLRSPPQIDRKRGFFGSLLGGN